MFSKLFQVIVDRSFLLISTNMEMNDSTAGNPLKSRNPKSGMSAKAKQSHCTGFHFFLFLPPCGFLFSEADR